jgi:hypothetical protein
MAPSDDRKAWILRLFEMEEREGRGSDCARFPNGARPPGIPLEDAEEVFGIYKNKYYFTPASLIIVDRGNAQRVPWADIASCSTRHGEGKTYSDLALSDGRMVRVRVGDMAKGWSGRISQLYHQMIERYGQRPAMGRPLMLAREFFDKVTDDYSIAPNIEPHPSLASFRDAVQELEQSNENTKVMMDLVEDDEELVAEALVIVSPAPSERFQAFAAAFHADGVAPADEAIIRRVGQLPEGSNVWHVIWD